MSAASDTPWAAPPAMPPTHYLDNRIYTDPEIFALERERIFSRCWKFLCHESEIGNRGDYRTATLAGIPLVVLRDAEGTVRAFYNICPHRGAALLRESAGSIANDRIQCFYHLWSFDTAGRCVNIPEAGAYEAVGLERDRVGLRPVRAELFCGMVFVCLDEDAPPLPDTLGQAAEDMRGPLEARPLEVFHYHRAEIRANWKLFVETNTEGYHELLHVFNRRTGVGRAGYRKRRWETHAGGHNTFHQAVIGYDRHALEGREEATFPGMVPNGHIVVDLFPDAMFNVRATVGRIDSLTPIAPGLTLLECRGIGLADDTDEERAMRVRHHNQVWGPSGQNLPEDIWAVETQWRNMESGALAYSTVAREEDGAAMDDAPVRNFYAEWRRRTGRASHDIDRDSSAAQAAE